VYRPLPFLVAMRRRRTIITRRGARHRGRLIQIVTSEATSPSGQPDRLLTNPDFLRVWLGLVATAFGTGATTIAMPLLVLALTGSPAQAGLVAAAKSAPYLVLGLPAGALIDRWNRRTILIACDASRGLAMATIPVAWLFGVLSFPHVLAVALVLGVALSFSNIAQVAALPRLVRRDQIAAAQALSTSSFGVASLIGPGMGGLIVGLGRSTEEGAAVALLVDALTCSISTGLLLSIRRPFQAARTAPTRTMRTDIVEGLRYLWRDEPIRLLAIVNMVHRMSLGAVVVLPVVVFGQNVLDADPGTIGLIVGAAGAGGLVGSAITPSMRQILPVGWHMILITVIHAIGIGTIALAMSPPIAMLGMAIVGVAEAKTSIVQVSYRLVTIPDALQGRVNSVYRLGSFGAMTLGTAIAGQLIEWTDPRTALWIMAGYVAVIAVGITLSGVRRI
jgi:MFS family permease